MEGIKMQNIIVDAHEWITEQRPLMVAKIEQLQDCFPDIPENDPLYKHVLTNSFAEIQECQDKLDKEDIRTMKNIIDIFNHLVII